MEGIDSGSPLPAMIGGTPTATAKLAGVQVKCLVDTDSIVTLILEMFYKQQLESVCGGVKGGRKMLILRGANGLKNKLQLKECSKFRSSKTKI